MDLFNFEEIYREFAALAMAYFYWYTCRPSYTDAQFLINTFTNNSAASPLLILSIYGYTLR